MDDYLAKPVDPDELIEMIERLVKRRERPDAGSVPARRPPAA